MLKNVNGISFVEFDSRDVVRHKLVKKIISAYAEKEKLRRKRMSNVIVSFTRTPIGSF